MSVAPPLQDILNSTNRWGQHVDDETAVKFGPGLRLMLIVIGVVRYQTPNMLALASLREISWTNLTTVTMAAFNAEVTRQLRNMADFNRHRVKSGPAHTHWVTVVKDFPHASWGRAPLKFLAYLWFLSEVSYISTQSIWRTMWFKVWTLTVWSFVI